MNGLDLLKRRRDEMPAPDPFVLARARQRLLAPPPPVRRPGIRPRLLVAGGLALTLAGGFLAADVIRHDSSPLPGTVADASTFLSDAAGLTAANPDAPIPPGQYRQITVNTGRLVPLGDNPGLRATEHGRYDTWFPADLTPPYVTTRDRLYKVDFATPEAREIARKKAPYLFYLTKPSTSVNPCKTAAPAGAMIAYKDQGPCDPNWWSPTVEFLAAQPRDPDALLAALRKDTGRLDPNAEAFRRIAQVLITGIVPADLRAALYQAARKIPGIQLLDDVVTIDGRRGRAIALANGETRHDLLIDPATGQYLGSRSVVITATGPGDINGTPQRSLTRGDIDFWSSVSSRITTTPPPQSTK